jgi:hypothetical protein
VRGRSRLTAGLALAFTGGIFRFRLLLLRVHGCIPIFRHACLTGERGLADPAAEPL